MVVLLGDERERGRTGFVLSYFMWWYGEKTKASMMVIPSKTVIPHGENQHSNGSNIAIRKTAMTTKISPQHHNTDNDY